MKWIAIILTVILASGCAPKIEEPTEAETFTEPEEVQAGVFEEEYKSVEEALDAGVMVLSNSEVFGDDKLGEFVEKMVSGEDAEIKWAWYNEVSGKIGWHKSLTYFGETNDYRYYDGSKAEHYKFLLPLRGEDEIMYVLTWDKNLTYEQAEIYRYTGVTMEWAINSTELFSAPYNDDKVKSLTEKIEQANEERSEKEGYVYLRNEEALNGGAEEWEKFRDGKVNIFTIREVTENGQDPREISVTRIMRDSDSYKLYYYNNLRDAGPVREEYKYLRKLTGRLSGAARDGCFWVLTDSLDLTYHDVAWYYLTSNTEDRTKIKFFNLTYPTKVDGMNQ